MKVILDIPDENLAFLGEQAKNIRQSRKAYMENILIQLAQPKIEKPHNQNKAILAPISVRDVENHDPDKKTPLNEEKKGNPYGFGDEKFLRLDKYSKFPLDKAPQDKVGKAAYLKEKAISDNEIKEAWRIYNEALKNQK